MTQEGDKLYVDAGTPRAALIDRDRTVQCPTLGEAVMEWHRLPADRKAAATIRVIGKVYTADQIDRMHYGSKKAAADED
ncbi:hypothetical protein [Bradyrhizobium sp. 27S5]|uniref:hypothetical protein n=1 Tax=Bradyrhizobium sp. 27S5 TaxID=3139728 RepID=UPI0030CB03D8